MPSPASITCPECRFQLPVGSTKCSHCGIALPQESAADNEKEREYFEWLAQSNAESPLEEMIPEAKPASPPPPGRPAAVPVSKSVPKPPHLQEPVEDLPATSRKGLILAVVACCGMAFIGLLGAAGYVIYRHLEVNPADAPAPEVAESGEPMETPKPAPASAAVSAVSRSRAATVAVRAMHTDGTSGAGTGYFVPGPGVIVTSTADLAITSKLGEGSRYDITLAGGTADTRTIRAKLIGLDRPLNLALLQITAFDLPETVSLQDSGAVRELDKVVVVGVPSADAGKAVTVAELAISGRRDVSGLRSWLLLSGPLPAGTAGGPVLDQSGNVIGITSRVPGTQTAAVVPSETLRSFIRSAVRSAESNGPITIVPPQEAPREDSPRPKGPPFNPPQFNPPPPPHLPPKPEGPPKAKMTFPGVTPVTIAPAPLGGEESELKLPGKVTETCIGGGGRYWCLSLPDARQVAVFDVNAGKVVKYIPLAAGSVKLASGMNKLIVLYPDSGLASRFDLGTFEKEATIKLPFEGTVKSAAMGSASGGPLLVTYSRGAGVGGFEQTTTTFLDATSFKELDPGPGFNAGGGFGRDFITHRAGPDGKVFVASGVQNGSSVYLLSESGVKVKSAGDGNIGICSPAEDGTLVGSGGLFTTDLKLIGKRDVGGALFTARIPAPHGNTYLALSPSRANDFRFDMTPSLKATVYMIGDDRPLVSLGDKLFPAGQPGLGADQRVLFCPNGKLIAVIAPTGDRMTLVKFDLESELDKSGIDYLYVGSRPPAAEPGTTLRYAIGVKSKKGGVKLKLESGPAGMKLEGNSVVWDVPKDWSGTETVLLTVSDASGQEAFHSFTLAPKGPAPAAVAVAPKTVPENPGKEPAPKNEPDPVVRPRSEARLLRAPEKPFPITPTKAADKAEVKLPGTASAVCFAGGGRFILFRIDKVRQVAVFDISEGKVVKFVPVPEDGVLIAGGMSRFYVLAPTANVIQRWNLTTLEKEATVQNALGGTPRLMLMGHASDGPLFVTGKGGSGFLDGKSLAKVEPAADPKVGLGLGRMISEDFYPPNIRVSADGRVFGHWVSGLSPSGLRSVVIEGDKLKSYDQHTSVGAILPGPDGTLFTAGGLYTPELKSVGGSPKFQYWYSNPIPAAHGPFYLAVSSSDSPIPSEKKKPGVSLRMLGEERVLSDFGVLDGMDLPTERVPRAGSGGMPLYDRVFFVPDAKALAILNGTGDRIIVHKVDLDELLTKSDVKFLFVTSKPAAAVRGSAFSYVPTVKSKAGGVKLKLEAGPEGMNVTGDKVTWTVPKSFARDDVTVILTVSDSGGQESFHTFVLPVKDP